VKPFPLSASLGREAPPIDIVDVGAMALAGSPPAYKPLVDAGVARVVGFEPQEAECAKLAGTARKNHTYLPYFIGDGTERTFYLTNRGDTSSLYEPNRELVDRYFGLGDVMRVVSESRVQTRRLDDVPEIKGADFLKVDVQGAELDVLRGGPRLLAGALVVEVEAEFVQLYKGQPLFAEVDQHIRAAGGGFMLHSINGPACRALRPFKITKETSPMLRQVLWMDAIYVPTLERIAALTPERLLKLAMLTHDVYRSADLTAYVLQCHDAQTGKDLWGWYIQRLTGMPPPERPRG